MNIYVKSGCDLKLSFVFEISVECCIMLVLSIKCLFGGIKLYMHTIWVFLYVYLLLLLFKIKQSTKNKKQKQKKVRKSSVRSQFVIFNQNQYVKQTIVYLRYLPIYYIPVIGSLLLIIRLNRHSFY